MLTHSIGQQNAAGVGGAGKGIAKKILVWVYK